MIHHVSLSEPPADFQVPDELKEQFWYDEQQHRLCFDNFMSKRTYDRLGKLSRDEEYLRALEELFRICVPENDSPQPGGWLKAVMIVIATGGLIGVSGIAAWLLFQS